MFFFKYVFMLCFYFAAWSRERSWVDTCVKGAVSHVRQLAPPSVGERHFSFCCSPQLPVECRLPFAAWGDAECLEKLVGPRLLFFMTAHSCYSNRQLLCLPS